MTTRTSKYTVSPGLANSENLSSIDHMRIPWRLFTSSSIVIWSKISPLPKPTSISNVVPGSAVFGAVNCIFPVPFSLDSTETSGEIDISHSGAPDKIESVKLFDELVGFKNSKLKDDDSPGKIPRTAFSALMIPIEVLLTFEIEIVLSPWEIAVKGISLKSLTDTVSGTTIFSSASTDLKAANVISPEGEPSILVCAPQSLLVYKSKVSSPLPSFIIFTG